MIMIVVMDLVILMVYSDDVVGDSNAGVNGADEYNDGINGADMNLMME